MTSTQPQHIVVGIKMFLKEVKNGHRQVYWLRKRRDYAILSQ